MKQAEIITVVLVSPGDVPEERLIVQQLIDGFQPIAARRGFRLEIREWKDVPPGYYYLGGIQERIDEALDIQHSDLVIAIFWKRFGVIDKPPFSRTAREVRAAMKAKRATGRPEVCAYFSQKPTNPKTPDESDQHTRVLAFKEKLQEAKVLTEDFIPPDFGVKASVGIIDQLDRLTSDPHPKTLSCQISCIPPLVRPEGYTEAVGDIHLAFTGTLPPDGPTEVVAVDVSITLSTNITSRLAADLLRYDSVILCGSQGELASARMPAPIDVGQYNSLLLQGIPIGRLGGKIDDIFTIKGIRADAEFLGVSTSRDVKQILCGVEVTFANALAGEPAIARKQLEVAIVGDRPTSFSAERITTTVSIDPAYKFVKGAIYTCVVHFDGAFADALKTQAQEASGSQADRGTILALRLSNVPTGCTVFATETNLETIGGPPNWRNEYRAVAVSTDAAGSAASTRKPESDSTWSGQIKMFVVSNNKATWELIRPISGGARGITFGVAFVVPPNTVFPHIVVLAGGLGPSYSASAARLPSRTGFPIPRFVPTSTAVSVLFDGGASSPSSSPRDSTLGTPQQHR